MMKKRVIGLCIIVLIASLSACSKIDIEKYPTPGTDIPTWYMYGRDAQRTNFYPDQFEPPLKLQWLIKASSALDNSIIVIDGIVYFSTLDGKIEAYHLASGNKVGSKKTEFPATLVFHLQQLFIARRYGDKTLFSYDLFTNKYKWRIDAGDIASEPLCYENNIVVTALYKHIDLYTVESGAKIWTLETGDQIRSSPAIAFRTIVFGCDDGYVYAVNASNGQLAWKFKTSASVQASPTINIVDSLVYIGSFDNTFYALNISDGQERWRFKTKSAIVHGAALGKDKIIFGSNDRNLYCVHAQTGELLWQYTAQSNISTSPVIAQRTVYFGSFDQHIYALNIEQGNELWKYRAKGRIRSNLVIWGDYLIGASEENYVYIFNKNEVL